MQTGDMGMPVVGAPVTNGGQLALAMPEGMGLGATSLANSLQPTWWDKWQTVIMVAGAIATPVLAYHGYKRNHSVGWAIGWGILGGLFWPVAAPIAFAQGFAKPKGDRSGRRKNGGFRSVRKNRSAK